MRGNRPFAALERHVAERVAARPGETLLAAVSGGADSVALAALLRANRCRLVLAHVNHQVRTVSGQDEALVLSVGASLGVRVLVRSLPVGSADEARLREERYAMLAEMAEEAGARRVFTAHHAQDQSETVLLALFRGAGPEALRGIPATRPLRPGISLERPLLRVSRNDLVAYCRHQHLPLLFDGSNLDQRYRRNAVRRALEDLRESFPHLDESIARCAQIASENADQTERSRLRERLREELAGMGALRNVTFERLDAVADAIEGERPGRHFLQPGLHVRLG